MYQVAVQVERVESVTTTTPAPRVPLVHYGGHILARSSSRKTLCGSPIVSATRGTTCALCLRKAGKLLTPKQQSPLELEAERLIRAAGLPEPQREYRFAEAIGRKWRFDFAWPGIVVGGAVTGGVALEIDGMLWGGAHTTGIGRREDMVRDAYAAAHGWRVFRCDVVLLRQGFAIQWIQGALGFAETTSDPTMYPTKAVLDPKRHARKLQKARAKRAEARA